MVIAPNQGKMAGMQKQMLIAALSAVLLSGCSIARSIDATNAKSSMVGMDRLELLSCAGIPTAAYQDGETEIFSYNVQNGVVSNAAGFGAARANYFNNNATSYGAGFASGNSTVKACQATITLRNGRVSRVVYRGQGEGLLVPNSECEPVIRNCVE